MDFKGDEVLHRAGVIHLLWKKNIRNILDGKEPIGKFEQKSHKDCDLTAWIKQQQQNGKFDRSQLFKLNVIHIELHAVSTRIMHLFNRGERKEAETEYSTLELLSDKLVNMLTSIYLGSPK